jgi:hypothetical protein
MACGLLDPPGLDGQNDALAPVESAEREERP